jgi:uncharacterized membrane protein YoaK (UPF0700 family)
VKNETLTELMLVVALLAVAGFFDAVGFVTLCRLFIGAATPRV